MSPTSSGHPELLWQDALDCDRCAHAILCMVLDAPSWVGRRVERVRFCDDQTATRRTSVDFVLPRHAPRHRHEDGTASRLVPLTVMRRKTLVNFSVDDASGTPLSLLGMRANQALTKRMIVVLAEVTPGVDHRVEAIETFAHDVAFGTQQQMVDAVRAGRDARRGPDVAALCADQAAGKIIERLANTFLLLVSVPEAGSVRRIVRYQYDEPLSLTYKSSGYDPNTREYPRGASRLSPLRPRRLGAALGLRSTVIRFPIPAAELARSYHFEVEAPQGVRIDRASLTAGRPNEDGRPDPDRGVDELGRPRRRPTHSWDQVAGGFPVVGLHACDVPSGSRSRAQVHLRLDRRGWLTTSLLSSVLSTGLLWAIVALTARPRVDAATVSTALLTVVAAIVVFVLAASEHQMAARLVTSVRQAAACSVLLLVAVGALVGLGGAWPRWPYISAAALGTVCTAIVAMAWLCARSSQQRISPWEQGLGIDRLPSPLTEGLHDLASARRTLGFDQAAVMVESSEGDNRQQFTWTSAIEADLFRRLAELAVVLTPARCPADPDGEAARVVADVLRPGPSPHPTEPTGSTTATASAGTPRR